MKKQAPKHVQSISGLLQSVFLIVTLIFVLTIVSCLFYVTRLSQQYDRLIRNAVSASNIGADMQAEISEEIWQIVIGRKAFSEGTQYSVMHQLEQDLRGLRQNTLNEENLSLLESAERASVTMLDYIDLLQTQMQSNAAVSENKATMEEINNVAALIHNMLQQYSHGETIVAAEANSTIQFATRLIALLIILLLLVTVAFMLVSNRRLRLAIMQPIQNLEGLSKEIADGNLDTRVEIPSIVELVSLSESLNKMAARIEDLIDENVQEQKNLQKAEMRALQAQITPHFLYNTFDTIVWLAEGGYNEEVAEVTIAFSNFYRISLSSGQDFIPFHREVEHVRNYLTIQSYRYQEMLTYTVSLDARVANDLTMKLILQPLVENSIYHGIKNTRDSGSIHVSVALQEDGRIRCEVADTGVGMSPEKIQSLYTAFDAEEPHAGGGYGLFNVNRRLKLYYGARLHIKSTPGEGTIIWCIVPRKQREDIGHV